MDIVLERELLPIVDRIYESVERPELWPETIHMMGETIGGRLGFWGMGAPVLPSGVNPELNRHLLRAGSHAYFLSRADLKMLDRYVDEFGELIVRFLKIICLSVLYSQNDIVTVRSSVCDWHDSTSQHLSPWPELRYLPHQDRRCGD
jgi:hypothetical protein